MKCTIQKETDNQIRAMIKDYHIVLELGNRLVLHDCADWSTTILRQGKGLKHSPAIYKEKETWEFKPYAQ